MTMQAFSLEKIIRKNVSTMQAYASARAEFKDISKEMIFLDANENPFENGVNRYPDPLQQKLRGLWAELRNIDENQVVFGNGSDELLDLLFRAFCEPRQDNVITLPPTYGMYGVLASLNDVENRIVLLDASFNPDVAAIKENIDSRTRIIFLCSPNNPTGNSFPEASITALLETFDGLVVIDEAYIDFSTQKSWIGKLALHPNLVVLQTLSKAYGLAGIRLGILHASAEIVAVLHKIKPPYNVNELTQQKALDRISGEKVQEEIDSIISQREALSKALHNITWIKKVYASEANFILIQADDAVKRYNQLLQNGIVVRNRSHEPLCENTLRITVGTAAENQVLIETLNNYEP